VPCTAMAAPARAAKPRDRYLIIISSPRFSCYCTHKQIFYSRIGIKAGNEQLAGPAGGDEG
jgi:hypothetical protein